MRQDWSHISDSGKQLITIVQDFLWGRALGNGRWAQSMNWIFTQTVNAVASLYGILCTMYHRIKSSNLLQIDKIWSRNFATWVPRMMPVGSAELGHTKNKNKLISKYWNIYFKHWISSHEQISQKPNINKGIYCIPNSKCWSVIQCRF